MSTSVNETNTIGDAEIRATISGRDLRVCMKEADLLRLRKYIVSNKADRFLSGNLDMASLWELYPHLYSSLIQSPALGDYRTIACDALTVWTQRASQCCALNPHFVTELCERSNASSAEHINTIFEYICEYWTDSGAALGNALRELFIKTILLIERTWNPEQRNIRLGKWVEQILKYPRTMRVVYFTLEILARQLGGDVILSRDANLIQDSLRLTYSNALANPVSKMITAILTTIRRSRIKLANISSSKDDSLKLALDEQWLRLWDRDVLQALRNVNLRQHIQVYLLPYIFRESPHAYKIFIKELQEKPSENETDISVLIGCLKIGQDLALLVDENNHSALPTEFLKQLLHHSSQDLRIGGLSLAVSCPQASKPIATDVLELLINSFDDLILESDPEFRNMVYGFMRQMTMRIRDSCYSMTREINKSKDKNRPERVSELQARIQVNVKFLNKYLNYLQQLLRPGSSYQRIHMSLRLLTSLIRSGLDNRVHAKWHDKNHLDFPFHIPIYTSTMIRLFIDNLINNYEDIRETSEKLLKMAPYESFFIQGTTITKKQKVIDAYASKGMKMITGLRGREGDGGAKIVDLAFYLYSQLNNSSQLEFLKSLVGQLENAIRQAEQNLSVAVKDYPLHGYLTGLRHIFENLDYSNLEQIETWKQIHERIYKLSFSIWKLTEPVLSHDSPEGNMPEEIDETYQAVLDAEHGSATQIVLSYAWRAIGESSGLLTVLFTRVPEQLFDDSVVTDIGSLLLTELATIRHRGAFSSVYPTFVACCNRCNQSNSKQLRNLPQKWLEGNIKLIQVKAQYITRRSGGIPYLVVGVLTAEADTDRPLLSQTFDELEQIALIPVSKSEEKMDLPQVHALNCIKTIFIETKLSAPSAFFVDRALELAINAFASEVWSIRNCGVMLFAALQNRLFGSRKFTDSRLTVGTMSARLFFSRFKHVKDILLTSLEEHVYQLGSLDTSHVETVYPVLSLLARLEGTNDYQGLNSFKPLILSCLSSRIWKVREIAAKSFLALVSTDNWLNSVTQLLGQLSVRSQNKLHGALLALHELLNSVSRRNDKYVALPAYVVNSVNEKFAELSSNTCSPCVTEFIRVVHKVLSFETITGDNDAAELRTRFNHYLAQNLDLTESKQTLNSVGDQLLQEQVTEYAIQNAVLKLSQEYSENDLEVVLKSLHLHAYGSRGLTISILSNHLSIINASAFEPLAKSVWSLIESESWNQVRGPAVRFFSQILSHGPRSLLNQDQQVWQVLFGSIDPSSRESNLMAEASLEALGTFTAVFQADGDKFDEWFKLVNLFSGDDESFSNRQAALNSVILYVKTNMSLSATVGPNLILVYFKLFDYLTDDDEELRDVTTEFINSCKLVVAQDQTSTTSITCRIDFARSLVDYKFSGTMRLLVNRLTTNGTPAGGQLANALTPDNALFVVEKQNLYRNDVEDADLWASLLIKLASSVSNQNEFNQEWKYLRKWTIDGLESLIKIIEFQESDGPLGWTGHDQVFLIGRKLIAASKVLRRVLPEREIDSLVQAQARVAELGEKFELHNLWDWTL
ncbi:putative death-receptor fusion protein-domain-containing protein [Lipomyces japonicus]|uniref:putative death-receptor fusion protein-domain-containing protein n=1 Tax=Lipomyces japonicus TaxID=56871 RepID=UPI0034CDFABE